jgi:phage terminase large subunit
MGESVLQLFEDDVLPDGHYSLGGVQRERRVSYTFNNGSKIVVAGLDTATRLMSAQYDIVAIFESTEIEESDYEMLATRLRNNKTPYKQLLMDCNPDSPNHWLYRLALEGKLQYLKSQHEDNPSLTRDYLDRLSRLTGHRRERLYVGNWVSAEGAVYPDFNKCVIAPLPYIPEGRKYGGIDFGWSDPTACVAGVQYRDSDDKLKFYVYYERYKPETSINDHAIALQRLGSVSWWADPSRPDSIEALIVEGGLTVNPAENDIILGVGRISTMIATGALQISNRCTALAAEAGAYVYPPSGVGEKPATGQADHALDALRYAVMALPSSEISYYNE